MDAETLIIDAFTQLGLETQLLTGVDGSGADIVLDPAGISETIHVKRRALVTEHNLKQLLAAIPAEHTLLIVADRVTEAARRAITASGGGYLDLRGRLAIRTDRLLIDAEVQPVKERAARSNALSGKAGLEVAAAILMDPTRQVSVRDLAREVGRSPSTVSDVLAALRQAAMTDEANNVTGTDLFWQLADRWPTRRTMISSVPESDDATVIAPLRLGLDTMESPGWALTDSGAAAAYGAPLAFRHEQMLDFFVPDQSTLRRAIVLLGAAESSSQARATVRVSPVPAVTQHRVRLGTTPVSWPLAHPLFVALDLAQDLGRGREILNAWTPDDRWTRVW